MSAAFTGASGAPQIPGRGNAPRYPDRGQRATLNGKPVIADGRGNWLDASNPSIPMSERPVVGTYSVGERIPSVEDIQSGNYGSTPSPTPPSTPTITPPASDSSGDQGGGGGGGNGSGRDEPAPDGSGSQGTQTSPRVASLTDVNELLTRIGVGNLRNPYASLNLPNTTTYTPANIEPDVDLTTPDVDFEAPTLASNVQIDGGTFVNGVPNVADVPQNPGEGGEFTSFTPPESEGGANGGTWNLPEGAAPIAETPQGQEQYETPDPQVFKDDRTRAFLDAPNSMAGLRAVEAQAGVVYAGGKYYTVNPGQGQEGQSDLIEISSGDADTLKDGGAAAQEFLQGKLDEYKGAATDDDETTDTEVTPADTADTDTDTEDTDDDEE